MNEAQSALLLGIALGFLIRAVREHMRFGSAIRLVEGMRKQLESLLNPDKRSAKIGTLSKSKTPPSPAFALGFFVLEPSP